MNKQKLFSVLSLLGVIFMIVVAVGYVRMLGNRGEVIEQRVEVPDQFARYFGRVITKNRLIAMKEARFLSPEGNEVSWSEFDGEYLLVNFWASWCAPCVTELPSLDKLQKKFKGKGLTVIAISLDQGRSHEEIKQYLYNRNIGNFAGYFDHDSDVQNNIAMRGIPTTYLLDLKGHVLHVFEGDANWGSSESLSFFQTLLNQKI